MRKDDISVARDVYGRLGCEYDVPVTVDCHEPVAFNSHGIPVAMQCQCHLNERDILIAIDDEVAATSNSVPVPTQAQANSLLNVIFIANHCSIVYK